MNDKKTEPQSASEPSCQFCGKSADHKCFESHSCGTCCAMFGGIAEEETEYKYFMELTRSLRQSLSALQAERDQAHAGFIAADAILDEIADHFNNEKRGAKPIDETDLSWLVTKTCGERPYSALIGDFHLLEYYEQKRLRESAESSLRVAREEIERLQISNLEMSKELRAYRRAEGC